MNFFKKVVLIIAPLMMIGSPTSGYDYFEHLVKEDVKCERCGSRGTKKTLTWHGKDISGNYPIEKRETSYSLYSVPYYENKVICPKCNCDDYSIQIMSLVKTRMPVYDTKKLEELKSDKQLLDEWPKYFDCGIKSLDQGNTSKNKCSICQVTFDRKTQDYYSCEYCGASVCGNCELKMKNYKVYCGKLDRRYKNTRSALTCPVCKWGMLQRGKEDYKKLMIYALDKMLHMGKDKFDMESSCLSAKAFTNSIIDNAKKSNKNKIYV